MSKFLDKAALLAAAAEDLPVERVEVPELCGHVFVRGMSGTERDAWEKGLIVGRGKNQKVNTDNVRAKLVARTVCTEGGELMFTEPEALQLGKLRVDALQRMFKKAQELSGVSDEDVEELGKGSAPADGSDSPSSSQ